MAVKILVIDDEPNITLSFCSLLKDEGYDASSVSSAEAGLHYLESNHIDLILLDIQLPKMSGLEFLQVLKDQSSPPQVLVISGKAEIHDALQAVRLGAIDFLEKPVQPERLISTVFTSLMYTESIQQRNNLINDIDSSCRILGSSKIIKQLLARIEKVAPTESTVLIRGENGTGKELVATRLYLESLRREKPFIKVNCPGIPETLFESELFGHKKGAFTGAIKDYPGKFALADGGTIFLDEIGDLPKASQAKLLRVLESGEIETLGAEKSRQVDVRIICATNRNMEELIASNKFREDLLFRISVIELAAPSLSEHREDIPLLIGDFLQRFDPSNTTTISPDAIAYLTAQSYPGNIRQLKNIVERLTIFCKNHQIQVADIISYNAFSKQSNQDSKSLSEQLEIFERQIISAALSACKGNISEAARQLKTDRANLSKKIKEIGLSHN